MSEEYEFDKDSSGLEVDSYKTEARDFYSVRKDPVYLAGQMQMWRKKKDDLEAELKKVNAWHDVLRLELIPTAMEDAGITSTNIAGLGRLGLTGDMYVRVKDKEGLFDWLTDQGFGDLIQPNVNSSTLKAFVKGRIKGGADYPEEYIVVTPFTRASITKISKTKL